MGVASARIDIKQAAGRAETLLERYAEPLTALHVAPRELAGPFLALAWRKVIENSAHDSICGCSIDPVVGQVLVRFAEAEQIGDGTLPPRCRCGRRLRCPRGAVAVVNPSPAPRTGLGRGRAAGARGVEVGRARAARRKPRRHPGAPPQGADPVRRVAARRRGRRPVPSLPRSRGVRPRMERLPDRWPHDDARGRHAIPTPRGWTWTGCVPR